MKNTLVALLLTLPLLAWSQDTKELTQMADTYNKEVAKALKPLNERYIAALTRQKELYTKAGKMEAALAADAEIKRITGQVVESRPAVSASKMKELVVGVYTLTETLANGEQKQHVLQVYGSGGGSLDNKEGFTWEVTPSKVLTLKPAANPRDEAKLRFDENMEKFQGTHWSGAKLTGERRK
jgi:hypothetical protein